MRRLLPFLLLTACYGQEVWVDTLGSSYCSRARTCDNESFEATYKDTTDCKNQWSDLWDDFNNCLAEAGCTYEASEAASCHRAIQQASCDEIDDGSWLGDCSDIYTCDVADSIQAGLCAVGF